MSTLIRLAVALLLALFAAGSQSGPQQQLLGQSGESPTDPNWSSVKLLLHMDGANGSSTWTDSSGRHTVTAQGTPAGPLLSTTDPIFAGTASGGAIGDTDEYLNLTTNLTDFAFGTGDFTVEWRMYGNSPSADTTVFSSQPNTAPGAYGVAIRALADNGFIVYENVGTGVVYWYPTTVANTWNHVAVVRASGVYALYYNGVAATPTAIGTQNRNYTYSSFVAIGRFYSNTGVGDLNIRSDELRVSNIARYTANFTPRRSAFPDS